MRQAKIRVHYSPPKAENTSYSCLRKKNLVAYFFPKVVDNASKYRSAAQKKNGGKTRSADSRKWLLM